MQSRLTVLRLQIKQMKLQDDISKPQTFTSADKPFDLNLM